MLSQNAAKLGLYLGIAVVVYGLARLNHYLVLAGLTFLVAWVKAWRGPRSAARFVRDRG